MDSTAAGSPTLHMFLGHFGGITAGNIVGILLEVGEQFTAVADGAGVRHVGVGKMIQGGLR